MSDLNDVSAQIGALKARLDAILAGAALSKDDAIAAAAIAKTLETLVKPAGVIDIASQGDAEIARLMAEATARIDAVQAAGDAQIARVNQILQYRPVTGAERVTGFDQIRAAPGAIIRLDTDQTETVVHILVDGEAEALKANPVRITVDAAAVATTITTIPSDLNTLDADIAGLKLAVRGPAGWSLY